MARKWNKLNKLQHKSFRILRGSIGISFVMPVVIMADPGIGTHCIGLVTAIHHTRLFGLCGCFHGIFREAPPRSHCQIVLGDLVSVSPLHSHTLALRLHLLDDVPAKQRVIVRFSVGVLLLRTMKVLEAVAPRHAVMRHIQSVWRVVVAVMVMHQMSVHRVRVVCALRHTQTLCLCFLHLVVHITVHFSADWRQHRRWSSRH